MSYLPLIKIHLSSQSCQSRINKRDGDYNGINFETRYRYLLPSMGLITCFFVPRESVELWSLPKHLVCFLTVIQLKPSNLFWQSILPQACNMRMSDTILVLKFGEKIWCRVKYIFCDYLHRKKSCQKIKNIRFLLTFKRNKKWNKSYRIIIKSVLISFNYKCLCKISLHPLLNI